MQMLFRYRVLLIWNHFFRYLLDIVRSTYVTYRQVGKNFCLIGKKGKDFLFEIELIKNEI